jgi:predicted RNase H-like nuclease (RuvC/YqgF family)
MKCPKCGCKTLANENTQGVWSCGTKSWSYCSDVIESPQCLRNQLKQRTAERDELRFENAKLKAELTLIDHEHKSELAQRTAERDELLAENHQLKANLAECETEWDALRFAISRGGLDISPCSGCGETVVCLPDGLPYCEACAKKLEE